MQMNMLIQMLMNKLQAQNPQGYKTIRELMQSNGDPRSLVKQRMNGMNAEERQNILNGAKQLGAPNEILSQIQNMK